MKDSQFFRSNIRQTDVSYSSDEMKEESNRSRRQRQFAKNIESYPRLGYREEGSEQGFVRYVKGEIGPPKW
jgi:hypothetical protein